MKGGGGDMSSDGFSEDEISGSENESDSSSSYDSDNYWLLIQFSLEFELFKIFIVNKNGLIEWKSRNSSSIYYILYIPFL